MGASSKSVSCSGSRGNLYPRGDMLVISSCPINQIVIGHSLAQIYRKPLTLSPAAADMGLCNPDIAVIVMDATGEQSSLEPVFSRLKEIRSRQTDFAPLVLLIEPDTQPHSGAAIADAVIQKPLTPEKVQVSVDRLLREHGSDCLSR